LPKQPSNISAIFAKVEHFNFGLITNHLLLQFLVFQPSFHPDNSTMAFISEFNVQILYLPSFKNVVANFCPAQTKQLLDQSLPRWWQIQWISKRWPPSKTVALKRSVC
jgi:hypothetical protein